jgi:hypothetical protein
VFWLAERWAVNDPLPDQIDAIVVVSYAATSRDLTNGSRWVAKIARGLASRYPMAKVLWGSFPQGRGGEQIEKEVKSSLFPGGVYVGSVTSSTDECQAMLQKAAETGISTRSIAVVAEGAHSRRCKIVWKYLCPNSDIFLRSIPAWAASDPENPMWLQRHWRLWLLANMIAYPFYRYWPGVAWFAKHNFSQPTL